MKCEFPKIMAKLRNDRGISQKQAAADLGVSQALLSHYEKGIRECGLDFLIKVADYYSVSCDYLLGRRRAPAERDLPFETVMKFPEALGSKRIGDMVKNLSNVFAYKLIRIICAQGDKNGAAMKGSASISVLMADSYISMNCAKLAGAVKKHFGAEDVNAVYASNRATVEALVNKAESLLEQSNK